MLREDLPLGEPCLREAGRVFSFSARVPVPWFSSVPWLFLTEVGCLVSVGEGNGEANFDLELDSRAFFVSSFKEPVSTSWWTLEADMVESANAR